VTGPLVNMTSVRLVTNTANQTGVAAAASMGAGGGLFLNRSCRVEATGGSSLVFDNRAIGSYQRFGGAAYVSRLSRCGAGIWWTMSRDVCIMARVSLPPTELELDVVRVITAVC
jgi:hypothetical protein